jgi:hypothetical protein
MDPSLRDALKAVERERGVVVLFPLLDLEDQSKLKVSDLWGGFEASIRDAAARYAPGAILTGRLSNGRGRWRGEWMLYAEEGSLNWSTQGKQREKVAQEGLEQAVDRIASRYAPVGGDTGISRIDLRVEAVSDLVAFGRVIDHLKGLDGVEDLGLLSAEPSAIRFRLKVRGGATRLEQGIRLGGLLERLPEIPEVPQISTGVEDEGNIEESPLPATMEYRLKL